jgi:hypothetical protein
MVNANGENTEYPWIKVNADLHQRDTNPKKARLNCSRSSIQNKSKEKVPHYPWRTEKRNSQHILKSDKPYEIGSTVSCTAIQAIDNEKPKKLAMNSIKTAPGKQSRVIVAQEKGKARCKKTPESEDRSSRALYMEDFATDKTSEVALLQREVTHLRKQLSFESRARRESERKFEQIQSENKQLYEQLSLLTSKCESSTNFDSVNSSKSTHDSQFIEKMEHSFTEFQQFLGILEEMGLSEIH